MSKVVQWYSTTPTEAWKMQEVSIGAVEGPTGLFITDKEHQKWEGFGGCFNELGWIALSSLSEDKKSEVFRSLFDDSGCRFNLCRLPIGASDYAAEWYSHNETDGDFAMQHFSVERDRHYLIPYIKQALQLKPDMKLFASPWSPPTWLKYPKVYNYGTLIWKKEYLDAYALYFLKFARAYKEEGITINQIHVQNEPVADQKFPSCIWTGAQMRDFIKSYLGPLFKSEREECEIWLGTLNTDDYNGFPNTALSDPEAAQYISGVGFQWAGKHALQRTALSWPQFRLMQTENECGNGKNTWEYAHYIFNLLWHYITNGVNAYVYWNMVLQPEGMSTWGWRQNSMVTIDTEARTVTYNPEYYVMKHFSRFIQPGAVRLGIEGPWTANAVAFRNPDGSTVAVASNPFTYERELTMKTRQGTTKMTLPAQSFNTVVLNK